jgi:hypothetical protein
MIVETIKGISMKLAPLGSAIVVVGVVSVVGTFGSATPHDDVRHRSSLRATVTSVDGTARTVTLEGVGCSISMCSRVRAKDTNKDNVWLDGLSSVRQISNDGHGPVQAIFRFKDGAERQASIVEGNRILYIRDGFRATEKLDLASVTRIDFQ